MNARLLDYITTCRVAGMTDGQIREELLKVGWKPAVIEEGLRGAGTPPPAVKAKKPKDRSPIKIVMIAVLALLLMGGAVFGFYALDEQMGWGILGPKAVEQSQPQDQVQSQNSQEAEELKALKKGIAKCDSFDLIDAPVYSSGKDDYSRIKCFSNIFQGNYREDICLRAYKWESCYAGIALSKKDERLCEEGNMPMAEGSIREKCAIMVSAAKGEEGAGSQLLKCEKDEYCFSYIFEAAASSSVLCEKVSEKDKCYLGAALASKNEAFCGKIKGTADKNSCYLSAAVAKADGNICKKISSNQEKDNCYFELFLTRLGPSSLCGDMLNSKTCLDLLAKNEEADPACKQEEGSVYYRAGYPEPACFTAAIKKGDEIFCMKIKDKGVKELCYDVLAMLKPNELLCELSGPNKDSCYLYLAKLKGDENICENSGKEIDGCYLSLAVIKKDKGLCAKAGSSKDGCEKMFEE